MAKLKTGPSSLGKLKKKTDSKQLPLHIQLAHDERRPELKQSKAKFAQREHARARKDVTMTGNATGGEDKWGQEVDERTSHRILEEAQRQMDDIRQEEEHEAQAVAGPSQAAPKTGPFQTSFDPIGRDVIVEEEEEEDEDFAGDDMQQLEEEWVDMEGDMSPADRAALQMFMGNTASTAPQHKTLADIIMEKIEAHESKKTVKKGPGGQPIPAGIKDEVVQAYSQVGQILSRYKSGKLPKLFKIIPSLTNWEDILYITEPTKWTPHAVFQATRVFASSFNDRMAQRFYNLVLYDHVRHDIANTKKLHYHLFQALKKAYYKPAAFNKGILIPLCESGTCTLKEATIIGSVISKTSIPVLHASAALLKIADMEYTGSNSMFIRILLEKKYALPYQVLDALVGHFNRFRYDKRQMPVLWHQSLLVFCQRYKDDITEEQSDLLFELVKIQHHALITPEIRRELSLSKNRGVEMAEPEAAPEDVMMQ